MEHRIERIEEAFNASGLMNSVQQDFVEDKSQDDLVDKFATLVVNEKGESKYIGKLPSLIATAFFSAPSYHEPVGSASPFSLLSPRGISWVSQKTGSRDLAKVIAEQAKWDWATWREFRIETWQPIPEDEREPLPTRAIASKYVECKFPIPSKPSFNIDAYNFRLLWLC